MTGCCWHGHGTTTKARITSTNLHMRKRLVAVFRTDLPRDRILARVDVLYMAVIH